MPADEFRKLYGENYMSGLVHSIREGKIVFVGRNKSCQSGDMVKNE